MQDVKPCRVAKTQYVPGANGVRRGAAFGYSSGGLAIRGRPHISKAQLSSSERTNRRVESRRVVATTIVAMQKLVEVGDKFWNIRGSFKVFGLLDVGTQISLVQLQDKVDGKPSFVFLDSLALSDESQALQEINRVTDDAKNVESIINLHPFHTVYCERMHKRFPNAKLYGTKRHAETLPHLPWQPEVTESEEFQKLYQKDLEFSVPEGVRLVTENPNVHFASVVAYHPLSKTIYSDDTFSYLHDGPFLMRLLMGGNDVVSLHPALGGAYEKDGGAGARFESWLIRYIDSHRDAQNLCTAHNASLLAKDNIGKPSIAQRLEGVIDTARKAGKKHDAKFS